MASITAAALALALAAVVAPPAAAHSWIESAVVIAPNGSFVGAPGFPRGYVARTEPGWNDKQPQHLIPDAGVYSGAEVLNKFPLNPAPAHPLLMAAPGDRVAILHLENGHVTLPENKPNKPLNRGTVFLYGTAHAHDQERLFDVHLAWDSNGTGGDARGRLLATRNYDDGQCFQDNHKPLAQERVTRLAAGGAKIDKELMCQSTITIPVDAAPGSVYTVYWYWDWPTLNPDRINLQSTSDGRFPWAGSFVRGDKILNGWTMDMIRLNESYSSVIDIRITDHPLGFVGKEGDAQAWVPGQDIYHAGIKAQVENSFEVKVDNAGPAAPPPPASAPPASAPPAPASSAPPPAPPPPASAPPAPAPPASPPPAPAPSAPAPSAPAPPASPPPASAPPAPAPPAPAPSAPAPPALPPPASAPPAPAPSAPAPPALPPPASAPPVPAPSAPPPPASAPPAPAPSAPAPSAPAPSAPAPSAPAPSAPPPPAQSPSSDLVCTLKSTLKTFVTLTRTAGGSTPGAPSAPSMPSTSASPPPAGDTGPPAATDSNGASKETVTKTVTVPATTVFQTIYMTNLPSAPASTAPSTAMVTMTTHVPPAPSKRSQPKPAPLPRNRHGWIHGRQ